MTIEKELGRIADAAEGILALLSTGEVAAPSKASDATGASSASLDDDKPTETAAAKKKREAAEKKKAAADKKKAEAEAAAEGDSETPDPEKHKELCRAALGKVQDEKGVEAAAEVLTSFGAKSIGKLEIDQYDDVIALCKSILADEPAKNTGASLLDD